MLLFLLACEPTSAIRFGDAGGDSGGPAEPAELVGETGTEAIPGDTSPEDTAPDVEPVEEPPLYDTPGIWQFTLELESDAWRELERDGQDYVPAVLGWEDRTWDVQVHIKGSSSWQEIDEKPSLVVDVNRDDPNQEVFGVKKFLLHNDCYDPSQMSETLAYEIYRSWGYPAARTGFAQLEVNGMDYGLYTVVEPHNDDFLEAWFTDPAGNLYENEEAYCDVTDFSCMDPEEYDEGNDDALRRFGDAAEARGSSWRPTVEPLLDWPRFIEGFAAEIAIVHWDSYSYDLSNYSIYHNPTTDEWTFLTQSMDLDFGFRPWSYPNCGQYGMDIGKYNMGLLAEGCWNDDGCAAELRAQLLVYADALEAANLADRVLELDAQIGEAVADDRRRYYTDAEYETHVACLQTFFNERPGQIREWVAANGG